MNSEFLRLLDVKQQFQWPVDVFRYGLLGTSRYLGENGKVVELSEEVKQRVRFSLRKTKIAQKLLVYLAYFSWVEMIFITGSVASLNAREQDDIDVWVIVKPRRIWITRAFDFFIFTLMGKRRLSIDGVETHRVNDKLCFNFYSVTTALKLPEQSISYAIQFVDALPVFVRDFRLYAKLLSENRWVDQYFPSWYRKTAESFTSIAPSVAGPRSFWPVDRFWDIVDYIAGVLMIAKAEKKVVLSPKKVFRPLFTTWGTPRILSTYDHETFAKSSQKSK